MNITQAEAREFLNNPNKKMLGMVRVSFGIYNSEEEIDTFLNVMNDIFVGRLK